MKKLALLLAATGLVATSTFAADQPTTQPVANPAAKAPAVKTVAQPAPAVKQTAPVATVKQAPAPAVKTVAQPAKKAETEESSINPAFGFSRGLANIATCWLELPRCMIYDNAQIPFFGLLVGVPEGAIFTVARAFTGVFDIATLGFSGDALHGKSFPDFVWESKWMPSKK
jgi:putative exosortase-associated protein (TIGR04073 family)